MEGLAPVRQADSGCRAPKPPRISGAGKFVRRRALDGQVWADARQLATLKTSLGRIRTEFVQVWTICRQCSSVRTGFDQLRVDFNELRPVLIQFRRARTNLDRFLCNMHGGVVATRPTHQTHLGQTPTASSSVFMASRACFGRTRCTNDHGFDAGVGFPLPRSVACRVSRVRKYHPFFGSALLHVFVQVLLRGDDGVGLSRRSRSKVPRRLYAHL